MEECCHPDCPWEAVDPDAIRHHVDECGVFSRQRPTPDDTRDPAITDGTSERLSAERRAERAEAQRDALAQHISWTIETIERGDEDPDAAEKFASMLARLRHALADVRAGILA
jgi:hypothetical protein